MYGSPHVQIVYSKKTMMCMVYLMYTLFIELPNNDVNGLPPVYVLFLNRLCYFSAIDPLAISMVYVLYM